MFKYFDLDFARGRLERTVINISGRASLVLEVQGHDQILHYKDLEEFEYGTIPITSPEVEFVPPKLGYVQRPEGWRFFSRMPERRWKQGIPFDMFGIRYDDQKGCVRIGKSLNGKFASYNVAKEARIPVAFSLNFAVDRLYLHYKGEVVGTVNPEGEPSLSPNYIYLREYLEECLS